MDTHRNLLNTKLLSQAFASVADADFQLENSKLIAQAYTKMENCISVLTDMKARRSYIYKSSIAEQIGVCSNQAEIPSIWEDEILSRIHPDDVQRKYRLELQFFQLLKGIDTSERTHYQVISKLRIKNKENKYVPLKHRIIYLSSCEDKSMWLALCLYSLVYDHPEFEIPQGVIINTRSGKTIDYDNHQATKLLSTREKEILHLIKYGSRSKEIADKLSLSLNTVNRHRQNIFQKLNVSNALEACRMAEATGLL